MSTPSQAILFDTNLLVLLVVGSFNRSLVGRKRLDIFTREDFDLLADYATTFSRLLTTPHVLTEVNNITEQCVPKRLHYEFREFFADFVDRFDEKWFPATELCRHTSFLRLGLSDAAIVELAGNGVEVISVDLELCVLLEGRGVSVTNFNN